jgi:DNA-binding CsgD family transcriptional regulator
MIGDDAFGGELLSFLYGACGADYCTVLQLSADAARKITTASLTSADVANRQVDLYLQKRRWRRDPMIAQALKQLDLEPVSLVRTAVTELPAGDYRDVLYRPADVCDRVLLCGRSARGVMGLSILRTSKSGVFSSEDVVHVHDACAMLMAIIEKHIELTWQRPDLSGALTSLGQIEACLSAAALSLSRREAEVCARILYGMSFVGIALDLGISEETVTTYRKRAYQRLGFASQRELLLWYLDLWGALHLRGSNRVQ